MESSAIVIGNGFDINLGLRTSYKDFLASEFFRSNINDKRVLFRYLASKQNLTNWIDIEKELAVFSKNAKQYNGFLADYKLLCNSLRDYILSLDVGNINKESKAFNAIQTIFNNNSKIISFNYTKSIERILKDLGHSEKTISENVRHIHGSAHNNNIIFGVDDRADINPEHSFLYKSSHDNYNGKNVLEIFRNSSRIAFFGHSLGDTDHMYFIDIFNELTQSFSGKKLDFYFYGDLGKSSLYAQLQILTNKNVATLKNRHIVTNYDCSIK